MLTLGRRHVAAWRALAEVAIVANPFAEPDFVLPATSRLRAPDASLLVVSEGSDWLAAVPVRTVSRWRRVPGRCLTVWRHPYCFLGTPLVAPERADEALAVMLRRATSQPGAWAFVLEWVDADGPFADALAAALPAGRGREPVVVESFERAALRRRPENDYVMATVSSRHRKEMRRGRRLLEQQVGALRVRDHAADEDAPRRFLELEDSGWKGRAGTAIAHDAGHAKLFVELCRAWSDAGRLQLLALENDDLVVSMKCNVRSRDASFCFKIAFDERYAKYSPGVQLELANIDAFHDGDCAWMDSCAAHDNAMINRLWEFRRRLQTLVLSSTGARGAVGQGVWRAACAGRDMSHHVTRNLHALDRH